MEMEEPGLTLIKRGCSYPAEQMPRADCHLMLLGAVLTRDIAYSKMIVRKPTERTAGSACLARRCTMTHVQLEHAGDAVSKPSGEPEEAGNSKHSCPTRLTEHASPNDHKNDSQALASLHAT